MSTSGTSSIDPLLRALFYFTFELQRLKRDFIANACVHFAPKWYCCLFNVSQAAMRPRLERLLCVFHGYRL